MKRILGIFVAFAFVLTAAAVYAQTQTAPAAAPAAVKVATAPVAAAPVVKAVEKDPKIAATEACKAKGLAGTLLDDCVKAELAKTVAAKPVEAPKTLTAGAPKPAAPAATAPVAKPAEPKKAN